MDFLRSSDLYPLFSENDERKAIVAQKITIHHKITIHTPDPYEFTFWYVHFDVLRVILCVLCVNIQECVSGFWYIELLL